MKISNYTNRIIKSIPNGLSQLEQARYIYIQLGRLFSFDEEFWFGNSETRKHIYKRSINKPISLETIEKGEKAICTSLAILYSEMLGKIGIDSQHYIEDESDPHTYNIINTDEGSYKVDLQNDLKNIQLRMKTNFFGKKINDKEPEISEERLNLIDKKIGYRTEKIKKEEELQLKIDEIKNKTNFGDKIFYIMNALKEDRDLSEMGIVEIKLFYNDFIKKCLTDKESHKMKIVDLYYNADDKRKYTYCYNFETEDKKYVRYLYSDKEKCCIPISDDTLIKLEKQGLKPLRNAKIPGLKERNSNNKNNDERN